MISQSPSKSRIGGVLVARENPAAIRVATGSGALRYVSDDKELRLARKQIERVPSLLIEAHKLAPKLGRLLSHKKSPVACRMADNMPLWLGELISSSLTSRQAGRAG